MALADACTCPLLGSAMLVDENVAANDVAAG